jgi:hypothetical protein
VVSEIEVGLIASYFRRRRTLLLLLLYLGFFSTITAPVHCSTLPSASRLVRVVTTCPTCTAFWSTTRTLYCTVQYATPRYLLQKDDGTNLERITTDH